MKKGLGIVGIVLIALGSVGNAQFAPPPEPVFEILRSEDFAGTKGFVIGSNVSPETCFLAIPGVGMVTLPRAECDARRGKF